MASKRILKELKDSQKDPHTSCAFEKRQQLLLAAHEGDLHRLQQLAAELDDGKGIAKTIAGIKDPSIGVSAIHLAAFNGHMDVCKYLIGDLNLDLDVKDTHRGKTPLQLAIAEDQLSITFYLVEMGEILMSEMIKVLLHCTMLQRQVHHLHYFFCVVSSVDTKSGQWLEFSNFGIFENCREVLKS